MALVPGTRRTMASNQAPSRTSSAAGKPSSVQISRSGSGRARSCAMSHDPRATTSSDTDCTNSRTVPSRLLTAFGVNRSRTTWRSWSCLGGSMSRNPPGPASPTLPDRSTPSLLENVSQSRAQRCTSACRDTAQKSRRSLRYTGASASSSRYTGYGSSMHSREYGSNSTPTPTGTRQVHRPHARAAKHASVSLLLRRGVP